MHFVRYDQESDANNALKSIDMSSKDLPRAGDQSHFGLGILWLVGLFSI